jgi:EAL domain-containing protein (putative c-di-GMP-specific phosphodiesterase class I)
MMATSRQEMENLCPSTHKECVHVLNLTSNSFNTYIQPIFSLHDLSTFGYEILNRPVGYSTESFYDEIVSCGCYKMVDQFLVNHSLEIAKSFPGPIFINVYPSTISTLSVQSGWYKKIVFELNERQISFDKDIPTTYGKGLTIALDDVGKGGTGLQALIEINPQFLKVDKWLIENIQQSKKKQEIVKFLVSFSSGRSKLIAEGIERPEELNVLKYLGVEYGQGYLLSKPEQV